MIAEYSLIFPLHSFGIYACMHGICDLGITGLHLAYPGASGYALGFQGYAVGRAG